MSWRITLVCASVGRDAEAGSVLENARFREDHLEEQVATETEQGDEDRQRR
jgi:hypothetical protein